MKVVASAMTDKGPVREVNEDFCCVEEGLGLFAVADGMGGHMAGEVASKMAIEVVRDFIATKEGDDRQPLGEYQKEYSNISNRAAEAVRLANRIINDASRSNPSYERMGTTLTAAVLRNDRFSIAHVGDSRAYLIRAGCIEQITDDHSLVAEQLKMGLLTEEAAKHSDIKNVITRALGVNPDIDVDIEELAIADGDRVVLCTDGITSVVSDGEILSAALSSRGADVLCKSLLALANERGSRDNMTIVAVYIYRDNFSYFSNNILSRFRR